MGKSRRITEDQKRGDQEQDGLTKLDLELVIVKLEIRIDMPIAVRRK